MDKELKINMYAITIDCKEPYELAGFYAAMLEWKIVYQDPEYAVIAPPGTRQGAYPGITFQCNPEYTPPVWPAAPKTQQQMAHLDFAVNDLEKGVQRAIECGAVLADVQVSDNWRVMFDPAGHPFCLCLITSVFDLSE